MPPIDIPVPLDLKKLFDLPKCEEIKLPKVEKLKITLPTGGSLQAIKDISKGIPTDCSLAFNLIGQLGPFLGSVECLLKVLKLLKPLIDVINGLPIPPVKALQEFAKAAADLAPCLLVPTPANMLPFIKDILCLILKLLKCFLSTLKQIVTMMGGIQLQLSLALASDNAELAHALECAQENAELSAQHAMQSVEPLGVLLELLGPFFGIAGVEPITLPALGSESDLESLNNVLETMQAVVATIEIVVEALEVRVTARDFIGQGFRFPIKVGPKGGLLWSSGPERLQDAVWLILSTSIGERVMLPDFGASAHDYVFQTNTPATRTALADAIRNALTRWEPRIELESVRVDEVPGQSSQVLASIDYRIRTTNELFNLVYPFYLEEGA